MASRQNKGLIQTVMGQIQPSELGPTTTHEHIHIDFSFMFRPAQDSQSEEMADAQFELENLAWIRRNYYSNHLNLQLMDVETSIREIKMYREVGGGGIVDATTIGIGRSPEALARISKESGVHIVMGAGYYVDAVHPANMGDLSVEDLAIGISSEITEGVNGSGIKAGIIGEVGCTWPMTANERKSVSAAAIAQQETGAAILIHPGRDLCETVVFRRSWGRLARSGRVGALGGVSFPPSGAPEGARVRSGRYARAPSRSIRSRRSRL